MDSTIDCDVVSNVRILIKEQIQFPAQEQDAPGWCISRIAHEFWRPTFAPKSHRDFGHTLFFVLGGSGRFHRDGGAWPLRPGRLFIFGGDRESEVHSHGDNPLELMVIQIHGRDHQAFIEAHFPSQHRPLPIPRPELIFHQLKQLFTCAKSREPFTAERCAHYLEIICLSIRAARMLDPDTADRNHLLFLDCRRQIEERCLELTSVAEVATAAGISGSYLCRLFKRHLRCTPQAYLSRCKMLQAAEVLRHSSRSIAEIAADFGFATPYAFSKAFKRVMALSPQHYRQRG